MLEGMFGKIAPGLCKLSMDGGIAIRTSTGFKTYDPKKGRLVNCDGLCMDVGEEFFFVIPTNKVRKGDLILVGGKPRCVADVQGDRIIVVNYENSTVDTLLPERHMFMGNTYMYGKIVSLLGGGQNGGKKNGPGKFMKFLMMKELMGGKENSKNAGTGGFGNLLPLMMMGGGMEGLFEGLFDEENDTENEDEEA